MQRKKTIGLSILLLSSLLLSAGLTVHCREDHAVILSDISAESILRDMPDRFAIVRISPQGVVASFEVKQWVES